MNKKQLVNKLNNQKGITGADIVIALLIILTTVGVITMVYVNLVISSREVDRKTGATRIATNILENMSQIYYDEITEHLNILSNQGTAQKQENDYTIAGGNQIKVFNTTVPNGYTVLLHLQNAYGQQDTGYDLVKKATVTVQYTVNGQSKKVEFDKVFERENVRECNSPNFTEEYIRQMLSLGQDYEMYSDTAKDAAGVKIICPIQYDKTSHSYQIITNTNSLWYSYSNKQWARVLVLNPEDLENPITTDVLKGENSYVWIPRYGIENEKHPWDGTYFKYKATDYAILNAYDKEPKESFVYHYMDSNINWSQSRGMTEQGLLGRWCPYSEISDSINQTVAYTLNQSQYGPMLEY